MGFQDFQAVLFQPPSPGTLQMIASGGFSLAVFLPVIEAEADGKVTPDPVKVNLPPHLIWLDSWRHAMLWAEEQMRRKK